jgi:hypothetical protein
MKYFLIILLFASSKLFGQEEAVTETGKVVLLNSNGTWKYKDQLQKQIISRNSKNFIKDPQSTFLLRSTRNGSGFWINPKKWTIKKDDKWNKDSEYELISNEKDLFAIIITEKIEVPLENLKEIVLGQLKDKNIEVDLMKEEYRVVNGKDVLMLQINAIVSGMKMKLFGYYFSNEKGTTQLLMMTGQSLFSELEKDAEIFLNGLVQL